MLISSLYGRLKMKDTSNDLYMTIQSNINYTFNIKMIFLSSTD